MDYEIDVMNAYMDKLLGRLDTELNKCKAHSSEKAVHDARVSIRRIISAIEILDAVSHTDDKSSQKHLKRLKDIHKLFSPLRDTHISIMYADGMASDFPKIDIFIEYLHSREKRLSFKLQKKLEAVAIESLKKATDAVKLAIYGQFKEKELYCELRKRSDEAFCKVAELIDSVDTSDMESIHNVRIAFKRFRYMVEVLNELQPVEEYMLSGMKAVQDELGAIQDITVVADLLKRFIEKKSSEGQLLSLESHELLQRQKRLVESFAATADDIKNIWRRLR